jgi:hypothetical protein
MLKNMQTVNEGTERAREQAEVQCASIAEMVTRLQHARSCRADDCAKHAPLRFYPERAATADEIHGAIEEYHDEDDARAAITDDVLSVEVRTDWHVVGAVEAAKPTHYKILLCWGGPAVQIVGSLDEHNQPDSSVLQYQDWFTPWIDCILTDAEEQTLIAYAQEFSFDA